MSTGFTRNQCACLWGGTAPHHIHGEPEKSLARARDLWAKTRTGQIMCILKSSQTAFVQCVPILKLSPGAGGKPGFIFPLNPTLEAANPQDEC